MDGIERTFSQKDMTFEEAVEYFKGRVPVTADVFYRIAEQSSPSPSKTPRGGPSSLSSSRARSRAASTTSM